MLPRLQDSYGSNGCSPQLSVDSIFPSFGIGLDLFIVSMKMTPGSPLSHACSHTILKILLALSFFTSFPVLGFMSLYSLSFFTHFMNSSVIATETLKFVNASRFFFHCYELLNVRVAHIQYPHICPP